MEDIEKLNVEKNAILEQIKQLDERRNQLVTRAVEIQGAIKFLEEKPQEKTKEEKK